MIAAFFSETKSSPSVSCRYRRHCPRLPKCLRSIPISRGVRQNEAPGRRAGTCEHDFLIESKGRDQKEA
jgi:hypothetical protein